MAARQLGVDDRGRLRQQTSRSYGGSVTMSSIPSSRANSASCTAEIPQSTVTIISALFSTASLAQGLGIDSIAFLDAVRECSTLHGRPRPAADSAQRMLVPQTHVDVVIAVNDDLTVIPDRPDDSLGGVHRTGQ